MHQSIIKVLVHTPTSPRINQQVLPFKKEKVVNYRGWRQIKWDKCSGVRANQTENGAQLKTIISYIYHSPLCCVSFFWHVSYIFPLITYLCTKIPLTTLLDSFFSYVFSQCSYECNDLSNKYQNIMFAPSETQTTRQSNALRLSWGS